MCSVKERQEGGTDTHRGMEMRGQVGPEEARWDPMCCGSRWLFGSKVLSFKGFFSISCSWNLLNKLHSG